MAELRVAEFRAAAWAKAWGCTRDGAAIVTGGALLWPVRRDGVAAMLKVIGDGDEQGAADVLRVLEGRGAVRLLDSGPDALLMERVVPVGAGLEAMALGGADDAATEVLCDLAAQVRGGLRGAVVPALIPLDVRMGALWDHATVSPGLRALLIWAQDLAGEMLADRADWTGLHGDLHHFNALHDQARGWLVIDPKGVLGPAAYDLANAIANPFPHTRHVTDPARMARQAAIASAHLGISTRQMVQWVCLHGCLAAAWDGAEGHWSAVARLAGRLSGLRPPE